MKINVPVIFVLLFNQTIAQPSQVDSFINSFVKENQFNGTILIEQKDKTVYKKSFGFANMAFKVPNTADTKYKVASITKAFTSVLILRLYEQGKIDLNRTFNTYRPDYKGQAGNKVTVKQLLNMTSGMPGTHGL